MAVGDPGRGVTRDPTLPGNSQVRGGIEGSCSRVAHVRTARLTLGQRLTARLRRHWWPGRDIPGTDNRRPVVPGRAVEDQPQRAGRCRLGALVRPAKIQKSGFAGSERPKVPGFSLLDPPLSESHPGLVVLDVAGVDWGRLIPRRHDGEAHGLVGDRRLIDDPDAFLEGLVGADGLAAAWGGRRMRRRGAARLPWRR